MGEETIGLLDDLIPFVRFLPIAEEPNPRASFLEDMFRIDLSHDRKLK